MTYFAVTIEILQELLTSTEVVVQAESYTDAIQKAKQTLFERLTPDFGHAQLLSETISIEEPREIELVEETPEEIPYVYDTYNGLIIDPEEIYFEFEPDYSTEPVIEFNPADTVRFDLWVPPEATKPVPVAFQNTSVGTPLVVDTDFYSRPTADMPRPLTTLPTGFTPLDAEFRVHAVTPYYLGGPACIELGTTEYCGNTGRSRGALKGCPAPAAWSEPPDNAEEEYEEEDEATWYTDLKW